jgi:hypothetical protein
VNFLFSNNDGLNCSILYDLKPAGGFPCSGVTINGGYVSGCTDAVSAINGLTAYSIADLIMEYCGLTGDVGRAAINITGGQGWLTRLYFEANVKNMRLVDTLAVVVSPAEFAAFYGSDYLFAGVAGSDRGVMRLDNRRMIAGEVLPDSTVSDAALGSSSAPWPNAYLSGLVVDGRNLFVAAPVAVATPSLTAPNANETALKTAIDAIRAALTAQGVTL